MLKNTYCSLKVLGLRPSQLSRCGAKLWELRVASFQQVLKPFLKLLKLKASKTNSQNCIKEFLLQPHPTSSTPSRTSELVGLVRLLELI